MPDADMPLSWDHLLLSYSLCLLVCPLTSVIWESPHESLCIVHLQAEMEASKMHNVLEYEDEIKARPARTWFQSERQKTDVKKRSAEAAADGEDGEEQVGVCKGHGDAPPLHQQAQCFLLQLRCSNNLLLSTCFYQFCALYLGRSKRCLGVLQGGKGKGSKEERKARKKAEHTKKTREEESGPRGKNKLAQETEMFTKVGQQQHRLRYP